MNQKTVGLTLRALVIALALILAASPGLPLLDGVAYAQLAGPTLVGNVPPGTTTVTLSWNAITGATGYQVVKQDRAVGTWSSPMDESTTSYTDSAVTAGSTYGYYVRAVTVVDNGDGTSTTTEGTWSNYVEVAVPGGTAPAPPTTVLTLTPTPSGLTTINLTWTADPLAAHYDLRYWTGTQWERIGGDLTTNSYSHTGLTSGSRYFYIVRAVNSDGNGPWQSQPYPSAQLDATTPVPVLSLTHPERLRVELSWTRVSATATYQVQRKKVTITDGGAAVDSGWSDLVASQAENTYTDATVTYGITDGDTDTTNDSAVYHYQVRAIENGEEGDFSNSETATIPADDALPPVPAGLSATPVSSSRINVSWSPVSTATSHEIQFKVGDGNYGSAMTRTAPYLHTNLSANTEYTYQVRAVNVNGHSAWSGAVSATTLVATARGDRLATPTGLSAVDATTDADPPVPQVMVTWNPSSKATSYELRKWNGTTWAALTLTDDDQAMQSHTDTGGGVEAGTTYYYIVAAINNNGTDAVEDDDMSDWSSPAMAMTDAVTPAAAPADLAATPRGENRIWVSWATVAGATEYVLQWRITGSSNWTTVNVPGRLTYAHTGRSAGTKYHYQVAAKNSGGMSAFSAEVSATTWARALSTPTGLMAEDATDGTNARIMLTWNGVSGAEAYEIQKWSGTAWVTISLDLDTDGSPDTPAVTQTNMTSYTDTEGLAAGMTYHYIIRAVSGDVTSAWTSDVSGMTKPTTPTAQPVLHLDPTGQTTVRLTWAPASGDTATYTGWELQYVKGAATADNLNLANFTKMSMTLPATPMYDTMSNLEAGTLYSYRIRGTLSQGVMGAWSNVGQIITRPATPRLTATSASSTSVRLTWTNVNPPGFATADVPLDGADFELQRRKSGDSNWADVDTSTGVTCASGECTITDEPTGDDALEGNMTYFYRIRVATSPTVPSGHPEIKSYWAQDSARTPSQ